MKVKVTFADNDSGEILGTVFIDGVNHNSPIPLHVIEKYVKRMNEKVRKNERGYEYERK